MERGGVYGLSVGWSGVHRGMVYIVGTSWDGVHGLSVGWSGVEWCGGGVVWSAVK